MTSASGVLAVFPHHIALAAEESDDVKEADSFIAKQRVGNNVLFIDKEYKAFILLICSESSQWSRYLDNIFILPNQNFSI